MKNGNFLLRTFKTASLIFLLGVAMSASASGTDSWKEEVLLHDGQKIVVERTAERGGRHERGQQPPIKEQSLRFAVPGTAQRITWKSEFSQDVGLADLTPLQLDIVKGTAYLVTSPVGCLAYNKWGRPNPPYVLFKNEKQGWQRIALQELPTEIKKPNLIISSPDREVEKIGSSFVSAEAVQQVNADLTQPEFKIVMREAVKRGTDGSSVNCIELVLYKGAWIMPNDSVMRMRLDRNAK